MSSLQIHKSRRPGDDPVKRARAVWKLCALTINMAMAMNFFIPNVEEFFETILSLFNQSNACLELRDGDQAEFLSRRLEQYEQTLRVMYQRLNVWIISLSGGLSGAVICVAIVVVWVEFCSNILSYTSAI